MMKPVDTLKIQNGIGDLYERAPGHGWNDRRPAVNLFAGERLALPFNSSRHGLLYRTYMIHSVVSSAIEKGEDPVADVDRARSFGHELVFIFGTGTVVHNGPRSTTKHVIVQVGMQVRFEGNLYTLETAPNDNLRLKLIVPETGK